MTRSRALPSRAHCPHAHFPLRGAVRSVARDGTVRTVAGAGGNGAFLDGVGTSAQFATPYDVAIDANGYLLVADYYNHAIRKLTPAGNVSTLAGGGGGTSTSGSADGDCTSALFNFPQSLAVDLPTGVIYVLDSGNDIVRAIYPNCTVLTVAGTVGQSGYTDNAVGTLATFSSTYVAPIGLAAANGMVYVADIYNNVIRRLSTA